MPVELENSSAMTVSTASGEASVSSSANQTSTLVKKKRNLPGMPDPSAEVIALSPTTLMATNRFVCEICNKGFQRDQNLQLHRRGHNLPWKLRQRSSKEIRKRVYVCPEPSCVHHDPSRALGDLTGIKKHFSRKHGEKKWKCEKCSRKYAVQSDWKAHMKICGTREYRCDCGTLFSRRDSFITHRAFCDALAEEGSRAPAVTNSKSEEEPKTNIVEDAPGSPPCIAEAAPPLPSTVISSSMMPSKNPDVPEYHIETVVHHNTSATTSVTETSTKLNNNGSVFASLFASPTIAEQQQSQPQTSPFSDLLCAMARSERPSSHVITPSITEPISLCLSSNTHSSLFTPASHDHRRHFTSPPQPPTMSATALLQKAAQMGASATNASLLRGLGLSVSSPSMPQENPQWSRRIEAENSPVAGGGLGGSSSSLFGSKPMTLDFLGLGMGIGGAPSGFSALISSIGGGLDVAAANASFGGGSSPGNSWEGSAERKSSGPGLL